MDISFPELIQRGQIRGLSLGDSTVDVTLRFGRPSRSSIKKKKSDIWIWGYGAMPILEIHFQDDKAVAWIVKNLDSAKALSPQNSGIVVDRRLLNASLDSVVSFLEEQGQVLQPDPILTLGNQRAFMLDGVHFVFRNGDLHTVYYPHQRKTD